MDAENLHRRFKKIIGQVQAIDRMVDEDVPCEDILAQINAAKSALHRAGQVVLEGHLKHCVKDGIEHGDADKTIENFTKAVERFANMKCSFSCLAGPVFPTSGKISTPLDRDFFDDIIYIYPYRYIPGPRPMDRPGSHTNDI